MKILLLFVALVSYSQAATLCSAYHCVDNLGNRFRDAPSNFHYCAGKFEVVRQNIDNSSDGYDFFWVASCPNNGAMKTFCNIEAVNSKNQETLCYLPKQVVSTSATKYPGEICQEDS